MIANPGAALLFHPAFKDGRVDPRALHSGEPAGRRKVCWYCPFPEA